MTMAKSVGVRKVQDGYVITSESGNERVCHHLAQVLEFMLMYFGDGPSRFGDPVHGHGRVVIERVVGKEEGNEKGALAGQHSN